MKTTNPIGNQKGLALVTTLVLIVLGFAVVAILFRLTTRQTQLTGLTQSYSTALQAAKAGTDAFITYAQNCTNSFALGGNCSANLPNALGTSTIASPACLRIKLNNPTTSAAEGAQLNWANLGCPGTTAQLTDSDPTNSPDITLNMTNSNYTIYIKLIDTYQSSGTGAGTPCGSNTCYYYTAVVRAQANGSPQRADVQFIYRYPVP